MTILFFLAVFYVRQFYLYKFILAARYVAETVVSIVDLICSEKYFIDMTQLFPFVKIEPYIPYIRTLNELVKFPYRVGNDFVGSTYIIVDVHKLTLLFVLFYCVSVSRKNLLFKQLFQIIGQGSCEQVKGSLLLLRQLAFFGSCTEISKLCVGDKGVGLGHFAWIVM